MAARARVFEYAVSVAADGAAASDRGGPAIPESAEWTPEHLLLAAVARCTLTSLAYHARRGELELRSSAGASGTVTRREEDGRFAFVSIDVTLDVALSPAPDREGLRELLARAERDCFVGASLRVAPRYRWTVNGEEIA